MVTEGFFPSCHTLPSSSDLILAPAQAFSRTCASFLSLPIPHTHVEALGKPGRTSQGHLTHKQHLLFFFSFFCSYSAARCGNPTFPQAKPHCQKGKLGVIPEELTPVVLTSPSPSSSVTGRIHLELEHSQGKMGVTLKFIVRSVLEHNGKFCNEMPELFTLQTKFWTQFHIQG